jgi:hypothetical protein
MSDDWTKDTPSPDAPPPSPGTPPSSPDAPSETAGDPLSTLMRARQHIQDAQAAIEGASKAVGSKLADASPEVQTRLAAAEAERHELASRLDEVEHQIGRLMTLYVATYQLHATLDPVEVQSTIAEIALNLIGAHQFLLLLRDEDENEGYEIRLLHGALDTPWAKTPRYGGGDLLVDSALADGQLRFGPAEGSPVLAAVPLRVQDVTMGALVIIELLPHKPAFVKEDRELLELLGAHAASALFASREYSKTARKLRTLESLMSLVKQG